MKNILCYGDSNTWGLNPHTYKRYDRNERWTGILQNKLGEDYYVIEEGLCGRTTVIDDCIEENRSGKKFLPICLESHSPIDLVILMLGTNDLKKRYNLNAEYIAVGVGNLIDIINKSSYGKEGDSPKVLLLSPPVIKDKEELFFMMDNGNAESNKFSLLYEKISEQYKCNYLDSSKIIETSDVDGIHLELQEHKKFANALYNKILEIL